MHKACVSNVSLSFVCLSHLVPSVRSDPATDAGQPTQPIQPTAPNKPANPTRSATMPGHCARPPRPATAPGHRARPPCPTTVPGHRAQPPCPALMPGHPSRPHPLPSSPILLSIYCLSIFYSVVSPTVELNVVRNLQSRGLKRQDLNIFQIVRLQISHDIQSDNKIEYR